MTAAAKGLMLGKSMMSFNLRRTFVYHTTQRTVQYPFKKEFRADRLAEFLQSKCDSVACATNTREKLVKAIAYPLLVL
jgi:hypothetical protein